MAAPSASEAKDTTPPTPVDAMAVDPPAATTTTATAAGFSSAPDPASLPPVKESIRQMEDHMRQWGMELTSALSVPNLQERWEKVMTIKKAIGDTMQASKHGSLLWFDAGVGKYLDRIKQEDKVLVEQPLAYANRMWKAGKMDDKGFMSVKAGLTMPSIPTGSPDDLMSLGQCRLICAPVRAAADDDLQSQKDVELERERVKAEQQARLNIEKDHASTKRKLEEMEKQIELLKAQSESFKAFTPEKAAASLAQTPVPKVVAQDDAVVRATAVSVQAAETKRLKGTWGTDEAVKEYLDDAWSRRGDRKHHSNVLDMGEGIKVRRVPGALPHLEFGEPWTF